MRCRPFELITFGLGVLVAAGCAGSATRVGLTNVPAREWRQTRTGQANDVIANSDDSCPQGKRGKPDAVPVRLYPCPGQPPEGTRVASPK